ncbi:MAG: hypothetical protein ACK5N8_06535 [Alphaproteobacteria bacterium]
MLTSSFITAQAIEIFPSSLDVVNIVEEDVFNHLDTMVQAKGLNFISEDNYFSSKDLIAYNWDKEMKVDIFDGSFSVLIFKNGDFVQKAVIYHKIEQSVEKISLENFEDAVMTKLGDYEIMVSKRVVGVKHIPTESSSYTHFLSKIKKPLN